MKKIRKNAACKRSKTRKGFGLKIMTEAEFKSRYPICLEVKTFLEMIELYVSEDQLGILTDCFLGFSTETQREMLKCILLHIVNGSIELMGVTHIDLLLCDMRDVIYKAVILPDLPVSKTFCEYSKELLRVFSIMDERKAEWEVFQADYRKLLAGTYGK